MNIVKHYRDRLKFMLWTFMLWFVFAFSSVYAEESVCAVVKIEIQQELTLERQAFDAMMRINNNLAGVTLENVAVDVQFSDEDGNTVLASSDPDNTTASFFIKVDSLQKKGVRLEF